jgi:hypothetical protein
MDEMHPHKRVMTVCLHISRCGGAREEGGISGNEEDTILIPRERMLLIVSMKSCSDSDIFEIRTMGFFIRDQRIRSSPSDIKRGP